MSVFSDIWDYLTNGSALDKIQDSVRTGGFWNDALTPGNALNDPRLNSMVNSVAPKPTPRPPALSPSDAIANFRQGERDSLGGGSKSDMPSIADIMSRLEQLQDPSRYFSDPMALLAQARQQASQQYDPVIAQLRNAMSQAQSRGERNRQSLGEMFGQLSTALSNDIPGIESKYADTANKQNASYDQLKQTIGQTYDQTQADQEAMMKRLNIEAAAPQALAQQQTDKAYFTNRANADQATANTALDQEKRGNVEYTRRGSEVAKVEGTQRQADLMSQLQDVLDAYQNQIGANEAAKSSAISSYMNQLQNQQVENAYKYSQRDFENYLASIKLGSDLKKDQLTASPYPAQVKSIADVPGRAQGMGLSPQAAQNLYNVFSSAVGNDSRILGGLNPESETPLTKEQLANYIIEAGRQQGLSQQELNALQAIALEYFGRA